MKNIRPRRITEYLEILWQRKMLFVLMSSALLISTFYIVREVPNLYESRASVVITAPTTDERLVQAVPFNLLTQQLTSRANLEELLEHYNLYPGTLCAPYVREVLAEQQIQLISFRDLGAIQMDLPS